MGNNKKTVKGRRIASLFDWWGRLRTLLDDLGVRGVMAGTIYASALAVFAWVRNELEFWEGALLFTALATLGVVLLRQFQLYKMAKKNAQIDHTQFGETVLSLVDEMSRYIAEREHEKKITLERTVEQMAGTEGFLAARNFDALTGALLNRKFGPRCLNAFGKMHILGIRLPYRLPLEMQYSGGKETIRFLSLMGSMLSEDDLVGAIVLSLDDHFMRSF